MASTQAAEDTATATATATVPSATITPDAKVATEQPAVEKKPKMSAVLPTYTPIKLSPEAQYALTSQDVGSYDAIYVNTPFQRMAMKDIAALPVGKLAADDSSLFIWCDSTTAGPTAGLIEDWNFTFHSVLAIVDMAEHPAPIVPDVTTDDEAMTDGDAAPPQEALRPGEESTASSMVAQGE